MSTLKICFLVMIGGSLGAMLRVFLTEALTRHPKIDTLRGTIVINSVGAFLLGISAAHLSWTSAYFLVGTGILGGFTTFSTLQVEVIALRKKGNKKRAYGSLLISVGLGFALVWAGYNV